MRLTLQLLAMLLDPRITRTPLRVLRELRRRGIRRLPEPLDRRLAAAGEVRGPSLLRFARRWLAGERITRHNGQWVVNSFLPPFPGPAFDRLFTNMLSGRHLSPVSAFLAVTAACPCACAHCSARTGGGPAGDLATAAWLDVIRQLHGLGVSIIGFTGGEPLLRPDLPALVNAAAAGGAAPVLFTTGLGLDAAAAARLRQAGLWALCVSLDSPDPGEYDRQRGQPGLFGQALAALRTARRHGFYTMASTIASRATLGRRDHLALHRLLGGLRVDEYRLVEPMPCGGLAHATAADLLTPAQVCELRNFHVTANRRGRGPKVCAFNQIESPEIFGCGAGTQHLYIDAAGTVRPCDFTPLGFGNVTRTPLAELWREMNQAMGGNPRRHCFIQRQFPRLQPHAGRGFPLPPEISREICRAAGAEPLPDYFAAVMHPSGREPSGEGR
ncbi:MAG: radical SAM protein [Lentisphaeria bacterium]|jgi:MoaA/NifB/PqqE/SkfB family radical SAM enzyme